MTKLSCFYSLSSPGAYFAAPWLEALVRRHKVELVVKPHDFQALVSVNRRCRGQGRREFPDRALSVRTDAAAR